MAGQLTTARSLALMGFALGVSACASASPSSPADVTRAQIIALDSGDEAGARALLAPDTRVKAPQWPARADLPSVASVVEVERSAMWPGEHQVELVRTDSGWAIRRGVLALFRLDTAEGALAAFGQALDAKDVALVLSLMPEESRKLQLPGGLDKAFAARAAAWHELGRAIIAQHVVWLSKDADRAEVVATVEGANAGQRHVVLVREATTNGWKVFDVQPWSEYTAP